MTERACTPAEREAWRRNLVARAWAIVIVLSLIGPAWTIESIWLLMQPESSKPLLLSLSIFMLVAGLLMVGFAVGLLVDLNTELKKPK